MQCKCWSRIGNGATLLLALALLASLSGCATQPQAPVTTPCPRFTAPPLQPATTDYAPLEDSLTTSIERLRTLQKQQRALLKDSTPPEASNAP